MDQIEIEKKRPGRPKKHIEKKVISRDGIVNEPLNKDKELVSPLSVHVVELLYDNPLLLKKIFHLFKTMNVSSIRVLFHYKSVRMYAIDHLEKSQVYIKIFGKKMNRYYCEEPLEISFSPTNIEKISQTFTKDHSQFIIAIDRQYKRSKVCVIVSNDEIDDDSVYKIDTETVDPYDWTIENELKHEISYPIKFELPAKYFKRKVADCGPLCDILRIEKNGGECLRFSYNFKDKHGEHSTYLKNSGKINLISAIEENDIFSTSIYLEHIKHFSSALIAEEIHISADKERNLIFTAYLDQEEKVLSKQKKYKIAGTEKCVIKVITEIVRTRDAISY
jgi:hypothetical protein